MVDFDPIHLTAARSAAQEAIAVARRAGMVRNTRFARTRRLAPSTLMILSVLRNSFRGDASIVWRECCYPLGSFGMLVALQKSRILAPSSTCKWPAVAWAAGRRGVFVFSRRGERAFGGPIMAICEIFAQTEISNVREIRAFSMDIEFL